MTHPGAFNARVGAFLAEPATPLSCAMARAMAAAWSHLSAGALSVPRGFEAEILE
jgi:hypothetical protein